MAHLPATQQERLDECINFVDEGCKNASHVDGHWVDKPKSPVPEMEHKPHFVLTLEERDAIIKTYESMNLPYKVVKAMITHLENLPTI